MSTLSRMRSWLGPRNLPTSRDGRYRLNAVTDWTTFQTLVCTTAGRVRLHGTDQDLWDALQLIRGEPLADIDAVWADSERLQMSLLVADVALELAGRAQRRGQTRQAHLAVVRGLLAFPGHPDLLSLTAGIRGPVAGAA